MIQRLLFTRLVLVLGAVALLTLGVVTIYSIQNPTSSGTDGATDNSITWDISSFSTWQNWQKQIVFAFLGLIVFAAANLISYRRLGPLTFWLYGLSLILLIFLLVGKYAHLTSLVPPSYGACRWIAIPFIGQIQPSEIARLTLVLALAWYLRVRQNYQSFASLLGPFALALTVIALIMFEPDLDLVILPVLFIMLFVAGARTKHLITIILLLCISFPFMWLQLKGYQRERFAGIILQNTWIRQKVEDRPALCKILLNRPTVGNYEHNEGYQLTHSKLAIATGSVSGQGFAAGPYIQYNMLPKRQNDFIFAVFAHQWGFIGAVSLLALYGLIVALGFRIALKVTDPFGRLAAAGITALLVFEIMINVFVTLGLVPVTGITLPLMSYGGSSLVTTMIALGLLSNIAASRSY